MNFEEQVHFIGIGGIGMSAIARVLLDLGVNVSGSDMVQKQITDDLEKQGAKVYIGHHRDNINGSNLIVYSSDIPASNVELVAAQEQQIPLMHRSDLLAQILNEKKGIAVAGSHGKTTTSSIIAYIMSEAGLDPTFILGGELVGIDSNARAGKSPYVVAEADESDRSFLKYHPYIGVITNIEADHLENYDGDFSKMKAAFSQFATQIKPGGKLILGSDHMDVAEILSSKNGSSFNGELITFGMEDEEADFRATDIQMADGKLSFQIMRGNETLGAMSLALLGRHNIYNALAATIVCLEIGLPFEQIAQIISGFQGAKRRFQIIGHLNDILIVDDYAVHPTEIEVTLEAAKATGRRVIAVFQPHRVSRVYYLLKEFTKAFGNADEVLITEIFSPAGEKKVEGITAQSLMAGIAETSNANIRYYPSKEELLDVLKTEIRSGDIVITLGAGDIWKVATQLHDYFKSTTSSS